MTSWSMARSRLDLPTALDLARAGWQLAIARLRLSRFNAADLITGGSAEADPALVEQISFAIRAMGARVPWRSDCLVQALAAQHWLASRGVGSRIHLGVKPSDASLDAHAWLKVGDRIVVGGDVADYAEFPLQERH